MVKRRHINDSMRKNDPASKRKNNNYNPLKVNNL